MAGIPYAPFGVRMLPINLLRQENITRWPDQAIRGRQRWLETMEGKAPPVLMPHGVGYQAWEKANDGFQTQGGYKTPIQDPLSVLAALRAAKGQPSVHSSAAGIETYPDFVEPMHQAAAAREGKYLPAIKELNEEQYITRIRPVKQPIVPPVLDRARKIWGEREASRASMYECHAGLRARKLAQERVVGLLFADGRYGGPAPMAAQMASNVRGAALGAMRPSVAKLRRHALEHKMMREMGLSGRRR